MIGLLQRIVDKMVCWVQTGATLALNACLDALGAFWGAVVALLPDMPGYPDVPSFVSTGTGYAYWLIDFGWLLAYMTTFFTLLVAVIAVAAALRWLKVIE